MIKVMFVCLGNICRSPMAEFVLKDMVKSAGRENEFFIASSATYPGESGNPVHPGTKKKLARHGIFCEDKRAVQFKKSDYDEYDYIICMDSSNKKSLLLVTGNDPQKKIYKLLDFACGGDIADPWYTGDFDATYEDVVRGCRGFLEKLY